MRACWGLGGEPLAQRLRDKPPTWGNDGLRSLIPEMAAQSLLGYAYTCPDMVGGGEISAVSVAGGRDQELYVRYAQLAACTPMMQFSVLPDRLDPPHQAAVREALRVREALWPLLDTLIDSAATTGEPILRPMAYHYSELAEVVDQFLLGPDLLVAPVLSPSATTRRIAVPPGTWFTDDGTTVEGPAIVDLPVTLHSIPRLHRF
ncbi:hypothetical protein Q0Z83_047990 [Actinoplanes sichuanensis]|nr:hypothetical protein Q0Z83_047990 [Actinoplanes sichuanensis]